MKDHALKEAFSLFSEESKRLEKAYLALQKEYSESNRNLNLIFSHLSEGIFFLSPVGKIVHYNPACASILGVSQKEALHQNYFDLFEDHLLGFSMRKCLEECSWEEKIFFLSLKEKEIKVSLTQVEARGVLCVLEDRTPFQKLERAIQQNNLLSEMGALAAGLAHEIRNPLGGISGFASLLCQDLKESPHQLSMAEKIVEGAKMLNRLVTSVLDYSKPFDVHFVSADLVELTRHALEYFSFESAFRFQTNVSVLKIMIDCDLYKMALFNLLRNASQASLERPVDVTIIASDDDVAIMVKDEGKGIPLTDQAHLFTPFFTTKQEGTGLGLADAQKAVTAIGGIITFETKENVGTTFTIRLRR